MLIAGQFAGGLAADLLQDAGAQQDVADRRRLGVEEFVHQVASQGAVVGDQLRDEPVRVGMGAHRERGQAQPCCPALCPTGEGLEGVCRQRAAVPGQEQAGFGRGESQVAGPDLGQLVGQPVTVQWQRIHPRGNHKAQAGRRVSQHVVKLIQRCRVGQQMQVVEDQRHKRAVVRQGGRKPQQEDVASFPPSRGGRHLWNGNAGPTQCRGDVGPEDPRPVVVFIHSDPGDRDGFDRRPQGQRRCLARARGAGDDSQRAPPAALGDQLGDPRSRHRPVRHARRCDLSCQDRDVGANRWPSGIGRHLFDSTDRHRDLSCSLPPASGHQAADHWR